MKHIVKWKNFQGPLFRYARSSFQQKWIAYLHTMDSVCTTTTIYSCKKYSMYLGSTLFRTFLSPKKLWFMRLGTYWRTLLHTSFIVHTMYLVYLRHSKEHLVSNIHPTCYSLTSVLTYYQTVLYINPRYCTNYSSGLICTYYLPKYYIFFGFDSAYEEKFFCLVLVRQGFS